MKKQLEKLKKFWKLIFGRTGILVFLLLVLLGLLVFARRQLFSEFGKQFSA